MKTEDIFGRPVESTDKLTVYWNWMLKEIQKNRGVHFINATEGGILRGNLEINQSEGIPVPALYSTAPLR